MLLANSFLLMATAYATEDKNIKLDSNNAKQNIQKIILSEWNKKNICSIVLFDKSWSMFYKDGTTIVYKDSDNYVIKWNKWNSAVSWAIKYSELLLDQNQWAQVWLILFGNDANYTHELNQNPFTNHDFEQVFPMESQGTYLGTWVNAAIEAFDSKNECELKYIILMSDWVPSDDPEYKNRINIAKNRWITIYSIWYEIYGNWSKTLRGISAWWFYEAKNTDIEKIFKNLADEQKYTFITTDKQKFKANTNDFIITQSWVDINNEISINSKNSNILGWTHNNISAQSNACSIIAWFTNVIHTSSYSTILWWKNNHIEWSIDSTIIWWWDENGENSNKITNSDWVTIWWWKNNKITNSEFSTIIWNNSTISWNASVAMWNITKNNWNNSFYWTDWNIRPILTKNNVFAVVSTNGMAINTNTPHNSAQLTISWNLAIQPNNNDKNIICWNWNWKGIIKAVKKNNNEICLCSCDWNERKSLHNWVCKWLCSNTTKPTCWTVSFDPSSKSYEWTCNSWTAIYNSYYVNNDNIIHRACQWNDGSVVNCTWSLQ